MPFGNLNGYDYEFSNDYTQRRRKSAVNGSWGDWEVNPVVGGVEGENNLKIVKGIGDWTPEQTQTYGQLTSNTNTVPAAASYAYQLRQEMNPTDQNGLDRLAMPIDKQGNVTNYDMKTGAITQSAATADQIASRQRGDAIRQAEVEADAKRGSYGGVLGGKVLGTIFGQPGASVGRQMLGALGVLGAAAMMGGGAGAASGAGNAAKVAGGTGSAGGSALGSSAWGAGGSSTSSAIANAARGISSAAKIPSYMLNPAVTGGAINGAVGTVARGAGLGALYPVAGIKTTALNAALGGARSLAGTAAAGASGSTAGKGSGSSGGGGGGGGSSVATAAKGILPGGGGLGSLGGILGLAGQLGAFGGAPDSPNSNLQNSLSAAYEKLINAPEGFTDLDNALLDQIKKRITERKNKDVESYREQANLRGILHSTPAMTVEERIGERAADDELNAYLAVAQDARDRQLRAMGLGQNSANAEYAGAYDKWQQEQKAYDNQQNFFGNLAQPLLQKWGLVPDELSWVNGLFK